MERLDLKWNITAALERARYIRHFYMAILINPLYVLGLLGNLFAMLVLLALRRATSPRFGRSAIDLLVAITLADAAYLLLMLEYTGEEWGWRMLERRSDLSCATLFYVRGVAGTSAILLFTVLSFSRLLLAAHGGQRTRLPAWMKGRACVQWMSAGAVCLALVVNVPRLVGFRLDTSVNASSSQDIPCRSHPDSKISTTLHMAGHLLFQRLGPALVITFLNLHLLLRILRSRLKAATASCASQRSLRRQRRLSMVCLILGAVYVVCFIPPGIYWSLIYAWDSRKNQLQDIINFHAVIGDMVSITATLSSAINLPVYLGCLPEFRRTARRLLCPRQRASEEASESETAVSLELHSV